MIRLDAIDVRRGDKVLLSKASAQFYLGDKVGLVGRNGTGKSSLFALLRGELYAETGAAQLPKAQDIAWVAQETPASPLGCVDYVAQGHAHIAQLKEKLAQTTDGTEIAHLHSDLLDAGAHTLEATIHTILSGLGFSQARVAQTVAELSGGWRMRLNLARALIAPSRVLLLDEPTNHLDLDAIIWLEQWLKHYDGLVIIISHDREFLDATVTSIQHLAGQTLARYGGNYSQYELLAAQKIANTQAQNRKTELRKASLEKFISRFAAQATKAKQAQSRVKMLAKLTTLASLPREEDYSFAFGQTASAPDPAVVLEGVNCGYAAESPILQDVTFMLRKGARIGLLGRNGAGKTTFIKSLMGEQALLNGKLEKSKLVQFGYFAQHQIDLLEPNLTPLNFLTAAEPLVREQEHRDFLASFGFAGDMVQRKVGGFSGGERARLALALIARKKPNILILDEPTNHLDVAARDALTEAIAQFDGALVLVSHDRHLLRATVDELYLVADGNVKPFEGDLDDYKAWLAQAPQAGEAQNGAGEKGANRKDERREQAAIRAAANARKKPLQQKINQLEKAMENKTALLKPLAAQLADNDFYAQANQDLVAQAVKQHSELAQSLETLELEWLDLQEQLQTLE